MIFTACFKFAFLSLLTLTSAMGMDKNENAHIEIIRPPSKNPKSTESRLCYVSVRSNAKIMLETTKEIKIPWHLPDIYVCKINGKAQEELSFHDVWGAIKNLSCSFSWDWPGLGKIDFGPQYLNCIQLYTSQDHEITFKADHSKKELSIGHSLGLDNPEKFLQDVYQSNPPLTTFNAETKQAYPEHPTETRGFLYFIFPKVPDSSIPSCTLKIHIAEAGPGIGSGTTP